MKSFKNIDAKSVGEAVELLVKLGREGKSTQVVSGGSELLQLMKDRVLPPEYLINLKKLPVLIISNRIDVASGSVP